MLGLFAAEFTLLGMCSYRRHGGMDIDVDANVPDVMARLLYVLVFQGSKVPFAALSLCNIIKLYDILPNFVTWCPNGDCQVRCD